MKLLTEMIRTIAILLLVLGWPGVLLADSVSEKPPDTPDWNVVLFSQPFCAGCEAARYYFHDHQIPYLELDISSSRAAMDAFERLGGRGTPFFLIGGEPMHGFSVPRLERLLMELGISGVP